MLYYKAKEILWSTAPQNGELVLTDLLFRQEIPKSGINNCMKTFREYINLIESAQHGEPLAEGVMDRLRRIYMGLVYDRPMGTPDSEFLSQWQREIKAQLGQEIDLGTLAKLQQNFRERGQTMMARGDATDYHREMGITEQGVAEGYNDISVGDYVSYDDGPGTDRWEVVSIEGNRVELRNDQGGTTFADINDVLKEQGVAEGSKLDRFMRRYVPGSARRQIDDKIKDQQFTQLIARDGDPADPQNQKEIDQTQRNIRRLDRVGKKDVQEGSAEKYSYRVTFDDGTHDTVAIPVAKIFQGDNSAKDLITRHFARKGRTVKDIEMMFRPDSVQEGDQDLEETQQVEEDPVAQITRLHRELNRR